jgi:acid phosphatase
MGFGRSYETCRIALASMAAVGWIGADARAQTTTPIEHLIVVIGENHTFDNVFAGYRPPAGQSVLNLLSQAIIGPDGRPGPNFARAAQSQASQDGAYALEPARNGAYRRLPRPDTTSAQGQPARIPDPRIPADLPNGPFQLTRYTSFSAFEGDPVHRFFQMWQQIGTGHADLFVWVARSAGAGNHTSGVFADNTHQGGVAMGFYNMSTGDAALLAAMARSYAIADNYHQPVMGGTGANFLALVTGDVGFYTDASGAAAVPPTAVSTIVNGVPVVVSQIENPDPQSVDTNSVGNTNWYTEDGYNGGSYVNCADATQPGVKAIRDYLGRNGIDPKCEPNHYYLVNNYNLGYQADGTPVDRSARPFTLPPLPASLPNIADALAAAGIGWKWYSGGRGNGSSTTPDYCGICDPLTAFTSVMTTALKSNLQDISSLYTDIAAGTLPAVAFVRPPETMASHPANSNMAAYENFAADLVNLVHANAELWRSTAIVLTMDEGGGYYDSGYVQALDFFGDGTRIPLLLVSPYAREGFVDHTYYDHGSILKFIERNWKLAPLSRRSRDALPNPVQKAGSYRPQNSPAIGDLMPLFDFGHMRVQAPPVRLPAPHAHE